MPAASQFPPTPLLGLPSLPVPCNKHLQKLEMPALSPTMTQGKIAKWYVKVGDEIAPGTVLADVETDKATMAFENQVGGSVALRVGEAGPCLAHLRVIQLCRLATPHHNQPPTSCSCLPLSDRHVPLVLPVTYYLRLQHTQDEGYIAALLKPDGAKDIPVGEPVAIIVEEAADVAAFANYSSSSGDAAAAAAPAGAGTAAPPAADAAAQPTAGSFPDYIVSVQAGRQLPDATLAALLLTLNHNHTSVSAAHT